MGWRSRVSSRVLAMAGAVTGVTVVAAPVAFCDDRQRPRIYTWGSGQYSQLGLGHERNEALPKEVNALSQEKVCFLSAGQHQTAALTEDGRVFTFGRAAHGRLGHGDSGGTNEDTPRLVEELLGEKVVRISGGYNHMACCTEKGELWTWGRNSTGQLGRKKTKYPAKVELEQKIKDVSCGCNHTLALTEDGKVLSWGGDRDGSTGHGTKKGNRDPRVIPELAEKTIIQIAAGEDFSVFLDAEGVVYTCGASDYGQTGHGRGARYVLTPTPIRGLLGIPITKVSAGQYHVLALSETGQVFSWGFNKDGQLGHKDNFHRSSPFEIAALDGTVCKDVFAGGGHSAVVTDSTVYLFGRGRSGQLGFADKVASIAAYRDVPQENTFLANKNVIQVALGADHSACLVSE